MARTPILACAAGLLVWAPVAWAQNVDELEQTFREVAAASIPRTVLIKAYVEDGRQGAGSGAIISEDGYILTCSHVVEIGKRIEVVTSDGTTYEAELLGRNVRQDYALVKIDATGLDPFPIGEAETVEPGDWVMALGHPGGPYEDVQPAFAAGKVRGLDTKLPVGMMQKYYNHAIMTDCPIFAGDSGGPLIDMEGNLVGINGAIVMINELAFAVPIDQIMADLDALKAGEVIQGEPAGPEAFEAMQKLVSPEDYQRMMQRAFENFGDLFGEDSPLAKMFGEDSPLKDMFGGNGEMPNLGELFGGGNGEMPDLGELFGGGNGEMPDLGELFGDPEQMQKMMEQFQKMFGEGGPGGGQMPDMGEMFEQFFGGGERPGGGGGTEPRATPRGQQQGNGAFLGVRAALDRAEVDGVVVEAVVEDGPAASAGLERGDVIVAIDGMPTPDLDALKLILREKRPGDAIAMEVERAEVVDTVVVQQRLTLDITLGSR